MAGDGKFPAGRAAKYIQESIHVAWY